MFFISASKNERKWWLLRKIHGSSNLERLGGVPAAIKCEWESKHESCPHKRPSQLIIFFCIGWNKDFFSLGSWRMTAHTHMYTQKMWKHCASCSVAANPRSDFVAPEGTLHLNNASEIAPRHCKNSDFWAGGDEGNLLPVILLLAVSWRWKYRSRLVLLLGSDERRNVDGDQSAYTKCFKCRKCLETRVPAFFGSLYWWLWSDNVTHASWIPSRLVWRFS